MFFTPRNIIYFAIAALLSGCVTVAQGQIEGTEVKEDKINLYCQLQPKPQPEIFSNPLSISINIDGSGSMLGYVNQDNSSYIQALELLDNTLGSINNRSQSTIKYYRSGDYQHQAKELTRSEFIKAKKPEFYNGSNAKLPAVSSDLSSLITKPKNSDALSIIVTDLAQNDGDVNLIANKIRENYFNNKDENYAVGIWGVKSEFDGTVYSATNANRKFSYSTQGKSSKQYRPFYILFLGNYQDIANSFDKLSKEQGSLSERSNFVIFSPNHLLADVSYLTEPDNISPDLFTPNQLHNGNVSVEKNNQPIELLKIKNNHTEVLDLKYEVPIKQLNYTLAVDSNDLKLTVDASAFNKINKQEFKQVPTATKALNLSEWEIAENKLKFFTTINPDVISEANIYYFKVDVVAKDLQKPNWWSEWNTNSGDDGGKTANLSNFMNSLRNMTFNSMDEATKTIGRFCYAVQKDQ
ncbi:hypothetical protein NIES4102_06920 [Chondrocystis sp. NIES-4102]|nr:hypothetical protein NIES4102_06920 [Chondrocystis sp. NIES-4102]